MTDFIHQAMNETRLAKMLKDNGLLERQELLAADYLSHSLLRGVAGRDHLAVRALDENCQARWPKTIEMEPSIVSHWRYDKIKALHRTILIKHESSVRHSNFCLFGTSKEIVYKLIQFKEGEKTSKSLMYLCLDELIVSDAVRKEKRLNAWSEPVRKLILKRMGEQSNPSFDMRGVVLGASSVNQMRYRPSRDRESIAQFEMRVWKAGTQIEALTGLRAKSLDKIYMGSDLGCRQDSIKYLEMFFYHIARDLGLSGKELNARCGLAFSPDVFIEEGFGSDMTQSLRTMVEDWTLNNRENKSLMVTDSLGNTTDRYLEELERLELAIRFSEKINSQVGHRMANAIESYCEYAGLTPCGQLLAGACLTETDRASKQMMINFAATQDMAHVSDRWLNQA